MNYTPFGAAKEVTGSCHMIQVGNEKILLDCGLFQGRHSESYRKNTNLGFNPKEIDAVILSHAHIDHCGNIPTIIKHGFKGTIHASFATRDLATVMLRDSAYVQERDFEFIKKRYPNQTPIEPLYTLEEAEQAFKQFQAYNYERWFPVTKNIQACFFDAGHILGSAIIMLELKEGRKKRRLVYTGDLGRNNLPIIKDPYNVEATDYLICESTYGNRLHDDVTKIRGQLMETINETVENKGKIIIPAFSLERTQEVVYELHVLEEEGKIPRIPIYIDSPLSVRITEIFKLHPECFDSETNRRFIEKNINPFDFKNLHYVQSVDESKMLNEQKGPMIIISSSGMCDHGRVLHHLKNSIEDEKNTILVIGFMAKGTLGRRIVDGEKDIRIFGVPHKLNAKVKIMNAFSAHADQSDLVSYIKSIKNMKEVFLVHGEEEGSAELQSILKDQGIKATVAEKGAVYELG